MDFLLLWVDGNDPQWRNDFLAHSDQQGDKKQARFRDWDNLRYWFRGVEKFAPWVNKIHFITCGHYPDWLNLEHPKLNFVKHSDYIPSKYLPTFNSNVIELFIHKIEDLSEEFVLFNDDFFIIDNIEPNRFFKNGVPRDMGIQNLIPSGTDLGYVLLNNVNVIQKFFDKRTVLRNNYLKWFNLIYGKQLIKNICLLPWSNFTGFMDAHFPQPFLKRTFREVWDKAFFEDYHFSHFRNNDNYSQYLMHYWQLAEGNFMPINFFKDSICLEINDDSLDTIEEFIKKQRKRIIVLNDSDLVNFEYAKKRIIDSFECILPDKSQFESK